jgi:hypothetical protein
MFEMRILSGCLSSQCGDGPVDVPHFPSLLGDCVTISEMVKDVMLNLFQHLIESIGYETLK